MATDATSSSSPTNHLQIAIEDDEGENAAAEDALEEDELPDLDIDTIADIKDEKEGVEEEQEIGDTSAVGDEEDAEVAEPTTITPTKAARGGRGRGSGRGRRSRGRGSRS